MPAGAMSSVTTFCSIDRFTALRIAAPASISANAYSNIIAAERIVAIGLAMFLPAACGYEPWIGSNSDVPVPIDADVINLLKQNIAAERCAVIRYEEIASLCNNVDYTTCDIAKRIMADEEKHEQDLQDLLRDIEWIARTVEMKC